MAVAELPLPPFPYEKDFFGSPFPKGGNHGVEVGLSAREIFVDRTNRYYPHRHSYRYIFGCDAFGRFRETSVGMACAGCVCPTVGPNDYRYTCNLLYNNIRRIGPETYRHEFGRTHIEIHCAVYVFYLGHRRAFCVDISQEYDSDFQSVGYQRRR